MNNHLPTNQSSRRDITESFSLLSVFDIIRRRKLLLLAPIILATAYSWYDSRDIPLRYRARVLMALHTPASSLVQWNPLTSVGGQFARIEETLHRRSVLEPVIREFNLYGSSADSPISERQLNRLRGALQIEVEGIGTFHLVFAHPDPQKAAQIVTRVSESFLEEMALRTEDIGEARIEVLEDLADAAEEEMLAKYAEMEAYKDQVVGPLGESLDGYLVTVSNTNSRLEANKRSIADLEAAQTQTQTEINQLEALMGYEPTDTSPVISSQRRALELDLERALSRYTPEHPVVLRIQADLAKLDDGQIGVSDGTPSVPTGPGTPSSVQMRLIALRSTLPNTARRLEFFYEERRELLSAQTEYLEMAEIIPEREEVLTRLMREHDYARGRYSDLLERVDNARLSASLQPAGGPLSFSILEPARVPLDPINPQRMRRIYLGFGLGVFLGIGLLLLAVQLDTSFADVQELNDYVNLPILASIPSMPRRRFSRSKKTPLPTLTDRVSIASEQFRILAVRLRDMIDREFSHVVLFTGSAGGEGKTTTVLNTAIALSQIQDGRVLLIDADLRRPRVRKYLPDDGAKPGTDEGLLDLTQKPDAVTPELFGRVGSLYVLAGTTGTDDSVAEIVSPDARKLLARLRKTFKYILIDSPPVLPMADSHLLAELADRVIFVVRARRTRRETLSRALEVFDPKNVMGLILNDVFYEHARYGPAYRHYKKEYLATPRRAKARLRIL